MPNYVPLFSSDRTALHLSDTWNTPKEYYYLGRNTMPVAWWFFWHPDDVHWVRMAMGWEDVKFCGERERCLALFEDRKALLLEVIGRDFHAAEKIDALALAIANWEGKYLLLDPVEMWGTEEAEFPWARNVMRAILASEPDVGALRHLINPHSSWKWTNEYEFNNQALGADARTGE